MSEQLPRHDIPQNEWTEIVIERETRRGVEHIRLRVPFTSNEVADIVAAREAISKLKYLGFFQINFSKNFCLPMFRKEESSPTWGSTPYSSIFAGRNSK